MKKIYLVVLAALAFSSCQKKAIPVEELSLINKETLSRSGASMLIGRTSFSALERAPYENWNNHNAKSYAIDSQVISELKKQESFKVIIYGATWCGDTRTGLPAFKKVIDSLGMRSYQSEMYMVNGGFKNLKQSPDRTKYASSIFRVPTFIIEKNGQEIGRIIEDPIVSFEKDLLAILKSEEYIPTHAIGSEVQKYLKLGAIVEILDLVNRPQFETLKKEPGSLNSLGYVLLSQHRFDEAIAVLKLNTMLYPKDSNTYDSLGEAYFMANKMELSKESYEKALVIRPDLKSAQQKLEKIRLL